MSNLTGSASFLSPTRFVFVIDTPEMQNISYHCQTVNIPSIAVSNIDVPFRQYTSRVTGDRIEFENFEARFIIEESMENYSAIYEWMLSEVTSEDPESALKKDVTLLIYNNNNRVNKKITFIGAFPISLSPVEFTAVNTDTQYLYADISFAIDYYTLS